MNVALLITPMAQRLVTPVMGYRQTGKNNPATSVDVELLDADGLVLRDVDGKTLLAADQVFGLVGGEWLQTSDGSIYGVSPA